ncbi:MAG: hypothetical protein OEZ25_03220 [Candidatus Bathyarchaeota archaeon]|nr:hypothetical protein [Candidatus Bathyarchaeota archaeon]
MSFKEKATVKLFEIVHKILKRIEDTQMNNILEAGCFERLLQRRLRGTCLGSILDQETEGLAEINRKIQCIEMSV